MTICLLFKLKVNFFDNYDILGEIAKYKCKLFFGPDSIFSRNLREDFFLKIGMHNAKVYTKNVLRINNDFF